MTRAKVERKWINQPSTLQPDHRLHGTNVLLVNDDAKELYVDVWFLSGPSHSMRIARLSLSDGWREPVGRGGAGGRELRN